MSCARVQYAKSFNAGISGWNMSQVIDADSMFHVRPPARARNALTRVQHHMCTFTCLFGAHQRVASRPAPLDLHAFSQQGRALNHVLWACAGR